MSVLVILGSARDDGDTAAVVDAVLNGRNATRLDLLDLTIRHYEYDRAPDGDDEVPFRDTSAYLHMQYEGAFYTPIGKRQPIPDAALAEAAAFGDRILHAGS